jgi:membrane protein DedA with SNARE-associated domain
MFEWVVGIVEKGGYAGVVLLMFLENVFPPIPSEVIMPLAGFVAARGGLNILLVILSGTAGSVAGAYFWFVIGLWLGNGRVEKLIGRFGRILTMNLEDLDKAREWFRWKANLSVFLGRLVPTIRTLISVPAGILPMRTGPFLFWSTLGTLTWTTLLAMAGYLLESQYKTVEAWVDPVSKVVVAAIVLFYLYRVITYRPARAGD